MLLGEILWFLEQAPPGSFEHRFVSFADKPFVFFCTDFIKCFVQVRYNMKAVEDMSGIDTLTAIAATGVDFISMGTLTKDVTAIDLSMRLQLINDGA